MTQSSTHLQVRSEDRDAAGNIAEPKGHVRRHDVDVVGIVVRPRRVQATGGSAEDDGGPRGAEVEEGEGTGKGAREGGKGAAEGGREGGKDEAKGGKEAGERRKEESEEGSESTAKGGRGGPSLEGREGLTDRMKISKKISGHRSP